MSYIECKENAKFRVIINDKSFRKDPLSQLPQGCTGLMLPLDIQFSTRYLFRENAEGMVKSYIGMNLHHQSRDPWLFHLTEYFVRNNFPIVLGDPVWTQEVPSYSSRGNLALTAELAAFPLAFSLDNVSGEVGINDWRVLALKGLREKWLSKRDPYSLSTLTQDMLMAQKAEVFARYQVAQGIKDPRLALLINQENLPVLDYLSMPMAERLEVIKANHAGLEYVFKDFLPDIYFVSKSRPDTNIWDVDQIKDDKLVPIAGKPRLIRYPF